jgi:hypothetical protein
MYVQAMDGDGTGMGRVDGRLQEDMFAAMMMVSEDKNKNTLVVARAKRGGLGRQKHHHHRARSFIGPPSSPVCCAWHVSVISRAPRRVPSHLPKHSSHHHTSSPSTTTATTEGQGTSPAAAAAILSYPALSCTTTVRPTTRLARFARTGVSWSLRLNRCLPCRRPQPTVHHHASAQPSLLPPPPNLPTI